MLADRLSPPLGRVLDEVQAGGEPDADLSHRVEHELVSRRRRDHLVELHVERAPAGPGLLVLLGLEQLAEPHDLQVRDSFRGQRGGQRFDRRPVLEELAELLGLSAQPLQGELGGGGPDERPSVPAAPDVDVLLVLQPAEALPHRHPVDPEPQAELPFTGQPLPGQVLVQPDGGQQQVRHLLSEPDRLRRLG